MSLRITALSPVTLVLLLIAMASLVLAMPVRRSVPDDGNRLHNSNAISNLFVGKAQAQSTLRINPGQRLDKGQKIEVAGKGSLSLQTDGNLVLFDVANQPRWASGTNGKPVTHVIMQPDGNLVIYNNATAVWASDTWNVGAGGGYFEIDLSAWTGAIHRADGAVAKVLFPQGPTVQLTQPSVQIAQPATVHVTNQQTIAQGLTDQATGMLKFPRQQGWEQKVLSALNMPGVPAAYASMSPFQQAIGTMALDSAEAYFQAKKVSLQLQEAIDRLNVPRVTGLSNRDRDGVIGLIAVLVIDNLKKNQSDAQSVAVRQWAEQIYRRMRADTGIGTLKEYYLWKSNPCAYSGAGYQKPPECLRNNPDAQMWKTNKPPYDLLGKAGMAYAANNNDKIAVLVAGALAGIAYVASYAAVASAVTTVTLVLNTAMGAVPVYASLFSAFGGIAEVAVANTTVTLTATEAATAGSLGSAGWAGVAAGPIAVITVAVTMGVTQGIAVITGEQAEWKLKQGIFVAMKEHTSMANVAADPDGGASLLLVGLVKSAQDGWKAPSLDIDGELTLFCEAGYVGKYYVTYTLDGQPKSFSTKPLTTGYWETIALPARAKAIEVRGVVVDMLVLHQTGSAKEAETEIFRQSLDHPMYAGYKVYGTVFKPYWSNDWPLSVGSDVSTTAAEVNFIHGAGYVAKWDVSYDVPGSPRQSWNSGNTSLGYKKTYTFPSNATNIKIKVQGATGLAWEPWRTPYDKTYPTPPNFCLKIAGTTLGQTWNNDCN